MGEAIKHGSDDAQDQFIKESGIHVPIYSSRVTTLLTSPEECFLYGTSYMYFVNYIWCLLIVQGRKTTRNMYKHCLFFNKSLSVWSRFLSQYKWDYGNVMDKVFHQIMDTFLDSLMEPFLPAMIHSLSPRVPRRLLEYKREQSQYQR